MVHRGDCGYRVTKTGKTTPKNFAQQYRLVFHANIQTAKEAGACEHGEYNDVQI